MSNEKRTDEVDERPLYLRWRPSTLDDVVGQASVVRSLGKLLDDNAPPPHAFLFTGPSGCGKTTLARIVGSMLGVSDVGMIEVDAATHSGVDTMRQLLDTLKFRALGDSPLKLVIVDECHSLSKQTWQSLLKSVEEPPKHVFWAFCTTEDDKVPKTVVTRCVTYRLSSVPSAMLFDYLVRVNKVEKLRAHEDVLQVCAKKAGGSVRQALVNLQACAGLETRQEALALLAEAEEEGNAAKLARMLVDGTAKWPDVVRCVGDLSDTTNESVRMVVVNYVAAVALNTKEERKAQRLLAILDSFAGPYNTSEKSAPLLLACGRLLFG